MRDDGRKNSGSGMAAILPAVLRDRGWKAQMELHSIFIHWSRVADESVCAHAKPLKIVKGTLWVEVENSVWLQELQYQKVALLRSINSFLQGQQIRNIRFVLLQPDKQVKQAAAKIHFQAPAVQEIKQFEEMAACIADEPTREALIRLWYLSKACRREE